MILLSLMVMVVVTLVTAVVSVRPADCLPSPCTAAKTDKKRRSRVEKNALVDKTLRMAKKRPWLDSRGAWRWPVVNHSRQQQCESSKPIYQGWCLIGHKLESKLIRRITPYLYNYLFCFSGKKKGNAVFCFVFVFPHLPFLDLQISWSKHPSKNFVKCQLTNHKMPLLLIPWLVASSRLE